MKRKRISVANTSNKRSKVINDGSESFDNYESDNEGCDVEKYQRYMQDILEPPPNDDLKEVLEISETEFYKCPKHIRCQLIREKYEMYKEGKKCSSHYFIDLKLHPDVLKLLQYVSVFYNLFHELVEFSFTNKFKYTEVWDNYMCQYIYSFFCTQFPSSIFKRGANLLKELLGVDQYIKVFTFLGVRGSGKTALNNCLDVLTMIFIRTPPKHLIQYFDFHNEMSYDYDFAMGSFSKQNAFNYSIKVFSIFKAWLEKNGLPNVLQKTSTSKETMDVYQIPQILGDEQTKIVVPSLTALRGSRVMYMTIDELVVTTPSQIEVVEPLKDKSLACRGLSSVNHKYLTATIEMLNNSSKRVGSRVWYKRPLCDECSNSPLTCVHNMDNQVGTTFFMINNEYFAKPTQQRQLFLIQSLGLLPKQTNRRLTQADVESVMDPTRRVKNIPPGKYKIIISIDPFAHLDSDWSYSMFLVDKRCIFFIGSGQIEGDTNTRKTDISIRAINMKRKIIACISKLKQKRIQNDGLYFWGEGQNSDMLTITLIKAIAPRYKNVIDFLKDMKIPEDIHKKLEKRFIKSNTGTISTKSSSKSLFIDGLRTLIQKKRFFVAQKGFCFNSDHETLNSWNLILTFILNNWSLYSEPKRKNVDCIMSMLFPMGILSVVLNIIKQ